VLIGGLVAFTVGLIIGGLAPTMEVLVLGRVVQGFGAGMVNAVSFATVALAYAPSERSHVLALLSLAWLFPSFLGPILGGLVAEAFGWRWVFLGLAVLMPVCALLVVPQVRSLPRLEAGPPAGIGGVLRKVVPPAGQVRVAAMVALLTAMAILGAVSFAPLALTDIRGMNSVEAGIVLALLSISWTAAAFIQGRLPRFSARAVARLGLVLLVAGLPLVALTALPEVPMPVTWVGWMASGLGAGFAFQAVNLHVMAFAQPGEEGRATAAAQFAGTFGNGAGTWLGAVLLSTALAAGAALAAALGLIFAACTAAAFLALLVTFRLRPAPPHGAAGHALMTAPADVG
jgi:predicted MFS family arabinose efflux permease